MRLKQFILASKVAVIAILICILLVVDGRVAALQSQVSALDGRAGGPNQPVDSAGRFNAAKARAMAADALRAGRQPLARLLLLNAVNQDPADIVNVTTYAQAVLHASDATPEDYERARDAVAATVSQLPAERVEVALSLVDQLNKAAGRQITVGSVAQPAAIAESNVADLHDLSALFERLKGADASLWSDPKKLSNQVESLRTLAGELADAGLGAADGNPDQSILPLAAQVAAELTRWVRIQRVASLCSYVDACVAKASGGELPGEPTTRPVLAIAAPATAAGLAASDANASDVAVSALLAADNALPQFWGEDLSTLPSPLAHRVRQYPTQIASLSAQVATARSGPILDQLKRGCAMSMTEAAKLEKREEACQLLERQLKDANRLYATITSPSVRVEAERLIETVGITLREARKAQYNAYQKWALGKCDKAFSDWDALHVYTSNTNAQDIYDNCKLYLIDAALLSPDIGRLHGDVLNKLFPNMTPSVQVAMWRKTQEQKWGLDRF